MFIIIWFDIELFMLSIEIDTFPIDSCFTGGTSSKYMQFANWFEFGHAQSP
jgi:hypothetical protein